MSDPKKVYGEKKPPLDATPPVGIFTMAMAMEDGADKYGPMNYRENKICAKTYYNAAMRHWMAWWDGEDLADDSGVHHLGHAMACACIILDAQASGTLIDDRPPKGALAKWLKGHTKGEEKPQPAAAYGHTLAPAGKPDATRFPKTRLWRSEVRLPLKDTARRPARVADGSGVSERDAARIADAVGGKPHANPIGHGLHFPRAHMSALLNGASTPSPNTFRGVRLRTQHVIRAMADNNMLDRTAIEKMPRILGASPSKEGVSRKEFVNAVNLMALLLHGHTAAVFRRLWLDYAAPPTGTWERLDPALGAQAAREHWRHVYLAAPMAHVRDFNFPFLYSCEWEYAIGHRDYPLWPYNPARASRLDVTGHAAPDAISPEGDHGKLPDAYDIRSLMRKNLEWLIGKADVVRVQAPVSENSKGVSAELAVAKAVGVPVAQALPHKHWSRVAARKDVPLPLLPFLGPLTDSERKEYDEVALRDGNMFYKPDRKNEE